jgi:hypothetical protein
MNALKHVLTAAAVSLGLGLAAGAATAAPAGGGLATAGTAANDAAPLAEKVYWTTRCWYHRGHRHCERVWVRPHRPAVRLYIAPRHRIHRWR